MLGDSAARPFGSELGRSEAGCEGAYLGRGLETRAGLGVACWEW